MLQFLVRSFLFNDLSVPDYKQLTKPQFGILLSLVLFALSIFGLIIRLSQ
ncbi:MAG TPA: hypothetical protein PK595_01905 [Bacteroidota bacterium]|jgi:hypothetical protein|nr:hypothetical protein [Bacteroidota bacterium]